MILDIEVSCFCRFGVAFTYYGISLNISGFGLNLYLTQFIFGAIELPSKLVAYLCLDRLGRRYSQVGTLITTGVCIGITVLIPRGKLQIIIMPQSCDWLSTCFITVNVCFVLFIPLHNNHLLWSCHHESGISLNLLCECFVFTVSHLLWHHNHVFSFSVHLNKLTISTWNVTVLKD